MNKAHGWRKVFIFTEALAAFVLTLWVLELRDSAAIVSVGTMIIGLAGATIYGNIKEHQTRIKTMTEVAHG